MRRAVWFLAGAYALLLRLYPRRHRATFGAEMELVFAEALRDAAGQGWAALAALALREAVDLPLSLARAHLSAIEHAVLVADGRAVRGVRWMARLVGLACCGLWLVILLSALDDGVLPQGVPAMVMMALTIAAFGLSWRWERAGALALMLCSVGMSLAFMYSATLTNATWLPSLISVLPGLPTLCISLLLLACARRSAARA